MKLKFGFGLGIAAVLLSVGAYWWLESSTRPPAGPETDVTVASPGERPGGGPLKFVENAPQRGVAGGEQGSPSDPNGTEEKARPSVGDILAEPDEDYVRVAKKLLAITLDKRAPMEEREEALAHALNLSAGNEAEVLTPLVKNPDLPDSFAETILSEALNRSLAYQADLYLTALEARQSPEMQKMIREHLAFLTGGEDKGPKPADWQAAIKAAKASWPE